MSRGVMLSRKETLEQIGCDKCSGRSLFLAASVQDQHFTTSPTSTTTYSIAPLSAQDCLFHPLQTRPRTHHTALEMAEVASNGPTPALTSPEPVPLDTVPVSPNGAMTDVTNGSDKFADGEKIVTVFDDPSNFNVKHQLQHAWTLWFTKPPSGKQDWNELLKEVITFDSVEEFWGIYVSSSVIPIFAHVDLPIAVLIQEARTTSHLPPSLHKSPTTISSSKACAQSGKTHRTVWADAGRTPSRAETRSTTRRGSTLCSPRSVRC